MPWNNADEMLVGITGQVSIGTISATLPSTPATALHSSLTGLGYIDEDGVSVSTGKDIVEFFSWQSRDVTRRELNRLDVSLTFQLQQWNENTVPFALGGGAISSVSGGYKYTPPDADDGLAEYALVLDVQDGSEHHRWVFPRGSVTEAVETQFNRQNLSVLPITFKPLTPASGELYAYYTDSTGFATGS